MAKIALTTKVAIPGSHLTTSTSRIKNRSISIIIYIIPDNPNMSILKSVVFLQQKTAYFYRVFNKNNSYLHNTQH